METFLYLKPRLIFLTVAGAVATGVLFADAIEFAAKLGLYEYLTRR